MSNAILYKKIENLPENIKSQVSDFIDFLMFKRNKKSSKGKPQFGSGKGMFKIKKGFDDPVEDFKEYM